MGFAQDGETAPDGLIRRIIRRLARPAPADPATAPGRRQRELTAQALLASGSISATVNLPHASLAATAPSWPLPVVLARIFPPDAPQAAIGRFGGLPLAGPGLVWPRDAGGAPLHFLLQIDCAALARHTLTPLPDQGLLSIFAGLDAPGTTPSTIRVLWDREAATGHSEALHPPGDLAPAYAAAPPCPWPWALDPAEGTAILPAWPIRPLALPVALEDPALGALLVATLGAHPEPPPPPGLSHWPASDWAAPDWAAFPRDWLSVQIIAAHLVRAAQAAREAEMRGEATLWRDSDRDHRLVRLTRLNEEARAWYDHALANDALAPLGAEEHRAFVAWTAVFAPLGDAAIEAAIIPAAEVALHTGVTPLSALPPTVAQALAARHALVAEVDGRPRAARRLDHLFGADGETLLELGDDPALGRFFGPTPLRIGIKAEDLAARRFDAAYSIP